MTVLPPVTVLLASVSFFGSGLPLSSSLSSSSGTTFVAASRSAPCDASAVRAHLAHRHVELTADLGLGEGRGTILTNDLTPAYIDENMNTS